jgi:DNA-binding HxlR family transcriptional regulator
VVPHLTPNRKTSPPYASLVDRDAQDRIAGVAQLARLIPGTSKKMLTQNLRQLEADGIIVRKDMSDLVLHIEYDLAGETRQSVCAPLNHLADWGDLHL